MKYSDDCLPLVRNEVLETKRASSSLEDFLKNLPVELWLVMVNEWAECKEAGNNSVTLDFVHRYAKEFDWPTELTDGSSNEIYFMVTLVALNFFKKMGLLKDFSMDSSGVAISAMKDMSKNMLRKSLNVMREERARMSSALNGEYMVDFRWLTGDIIDTVGLPWFTPEGEEELIDIYRRFMDGAQKQEEK